MFKRPSPGRRRPGLSGGPLTRSNVRCNLAMRKIEDVTIQCRVLENGKPSSSTTHFENSAFEVKIEGGRAVFKFKDPVSSLEEAERRVREYLKSWCGDQDLQTGGTRREIELESVSAPGHGGRFYGPIMTTKITGPQAEANTRRYSPWRRHRHYNQPLISSLIQRYEDYRRGRERLAVLGYLCLTALESKFGGRSQVARSCRIDSAVLETLGRLVSTVGTHYTARKIGKANHQLRSFTEEEVFWLERTIHQLIGRAGAILLGEQLASQLSMRDLPILMAAPDPPLHRKADADGEGK